MSRTQTKAQLLAIIDQQTEQLSTAHRVIRQLRGDADMHRKSRRQAMDAARAEAMKLGRYVPVAQVH